MPLIFKDLLRGGKIPPPANAVNLRVSILSRCLSERYGLPDGAVLIGEICDILDWFGKPIESLRELIGFETKLILKKFFDYDCLYISKESWQHLKKYGITSDVCVVELKIKQALVGEKIIEIYPMTNKVAEVL